MTAESTPASSVGDIFVPCAGSEIFDGKDAREIVADIWKQDPDRTGKFLVVFLDDAETIGAYDPSVIAFPKKSIATMNVLERYTETIQWKRLEDTLPRAVLDFPEKEKRIVILLKFIVASLEVEDTEITSFLMSILFALIPETEILGVYVDYAPSAERAETDLLLKVAFLENEKPAV